MQSYDLEDLKGLTEKEVIELQEKFGKNELLKEKKETFFSKTIHIIKEPMFLLLITASIIYFILGEPRDGLIMLIFVIGIIGIEVIQEWKTDKTLNALKELSSPKVTLIRNGDKQIYYSTEVVPGDIMIISEGDKIPADGEILKANDLCIDESSLTGEALGVWKVSTINYKKDDDDYWRKDYCYAGTLVTQGSAIVSVDKTGINTEYGKIGQNLNDAPDIITPLQKQTGKLVKTCSIIAGILFLLTVVITYFNITDHGFKDRIIESILSGITLSMAMIPEEFPVVLTVFLSMGAWRLAKKQSLVRRLPSVETLGSVSVLCTDKTGTITMNQMVIKEIYPYQTSDEDLIETMGLACETEPYDPMEIAILDYCEKNGVTKKHLFESEFVTEYAFTNELKMMGHVWVHEDEIIIAAKGSAESILDICLLTENEKNEINNKILEMSKKGLRVIAVGIMKPKDKNSIPTDILDLKLHFSGLIGLFDPPRESVKQDIKRCIEAGIKVVMITGDNGITASSIAKEIGIPNNDTVCTGSELEEMTDEQLRNIVKETNIFSRVLPEHKMKIVKAFRDNGEIVAMTGDGVNDAPALKYADIGIAMGKRGSDVSREAADLVLLDDNFSTIVDTISDGRRIYDNIRKAMGYVFTIHIPIAFAALLAPLLKIPPENLLLFPLHVVLLELLIDPTCSIVLERQPAEMDIMSKKPRNVNENILTINSFLKSIIQGLVIFAFSFGTYYITLKNGENVLVSRSMGLGIIMLSNLFLVFVNSSSTDFLFHTIKDLLKDKVVFLSTIATILILLISLYSPLSNILKLTALSFNQLLTTILFSLLAVLWYEFVKLFIKMKSNFHKI